MQSSAMIQKAAAVPLVGDVFDVMWRSNRRNMRLLQEWLAVEERRGRKPYKAALTVSLPPRALGMGRLQDLGQRRQRALGRRLDCAGH
jgi:Domain of unknown function (DUF4112)